MKNIIKIFVSLLLVFSFNSCVDSNNTIDEVFNYETGAVLRTIAVNSNTLNSSDNSSAWSVTIEEQDEQDGALLQSVSVYVSMRDLTPGNGTTVAADAFIKTIDASAFTAGPVGLPRAIISATFGEATSALGLSPAQYEPGDIYVFELRLELTDGRIFGASSASGIITGGFFASPFKYNAIILCSPEPGVYTIALQDNYGDGWQGSQVIANIDGVANAVSIPSYWDCATGCGGVGDAPWSDISMTITIPVGTLETTWEYVGGSYPSECEFQVYAPDGTLLGSFGPSPSPGLLPITLCAL